MLIIVNKNQFKRDYRKAQRRGKNMAKLITVIEVLAAENKLDPKYKDHALSGTYAGLRDCHIEPDWILLYEIETALKELRLVRTGTHADLFDT